MHLAAKRVHAVPPNRPWYNTRDKFGFLWLEYSPFRPSQSSRLNLSPWNYHTIMLSADCMGTFFKKNSISATGARLRLATSRINSNEEMGNSSATQIIFWQELLETVVNKHVQAAVPKIEPVHHIDHVRISKLEKLAQSTRFWRFNAVRSAY